MGDSLDLSFAPSFDRFFDHSFYSPLLLRFLFDFHSETAIETFCHLAPRTRDGAKHVWRMRKCNFVPILSPDRENILGTRLDIVNGLFSI